MRKPNVGAGSGPIRWGYGQSAHGRGPLECLWCSSAVRNARHLEKVLIPSVAEGKVPWRRAQDEWSLLKCACRCGSGRHDGVRQVIDWVESGKRRCGRGQ